MRFPLRLHRGGYDVKRGGGLRRRSTLGLGCFVIRLEALNERDYRDALAIPISRVRETFQAKSRVWKRQLCTAPSRYCDLLTLSSHLLFSLHIYKSIFALFCSGNLSSVLVHVFQTSKLFLLYSL